MRFTVLSFVLQMPHLTLEEEAATLKGSALSADEKAALKERAHYVQQWLMQYAPAEYRYAILPSAPVMELSDGQKNALRTLHEALGKADLAWDGPALHAAIHAVKEASDLEPKELFGPLYQMLLGRSSGPQMGWFLSTFKREDILSRLAALTV
jgi:lysyl-tRNA synthetase class 1